MKRRLIDQRSIRRLDFSQVEGDIGISFAIAEAPKKIKSKNYQFSQFMFGEESSAIPASIMESFLKWSLGLLDKIKKPDAILSPEPNGIIWGALVAQAVNVPLLISRSIRGCGILVENDYSSKDMALEVYGQGQRLLIVDDISSSGVTLNVLKKLALENGFIVDDALVVYAKNLDIETDLIVHSFG